MHFYIELNDVRYTLAILDRKYGTGFRRIVAWTE
jgi:hypothetical protein